MTKVGCLIAAGVAVLLVLIVGLTSISKYNGLVRSEEKIDKQWAEVDNMLQRRADLIPNVVATVKGYAEHEKEIFESVANARSALLGANGVAAKGQAAGALDSALGRLLAIAENYPNLKADASFRRLQDELAGSENRVAVARTRYNESVEAFNAKIRVFPDSIFAGMLRLERRDYFEVTEPTKRDVPNVDFSDAAAE